ncbi:MAG: serine/threonine protein kinase [Myxococcales bacterium]|nr:serine/threonine protein kinase [Myxococcales bacterium]
MGNAQEAGRVVGRYVLYDEIASGGMATIHLGRMIGQVGFARTVAIKRLHPHFAKDPEFVAMFIDEARLAAGIRHPNVVATLDVVALEGDLFLVMEYVEGDSLSHLVKRVHARDQRIPPGVVSGILSNVLYGLHAAHTAADDRGEALSIVHRDVSPQNILVGLDGVARVVDFGVAKAARRIMETEAGRIKGKFRYMAPEQIRADKFDCRVDVFAAGIVLWEALVGRGLFVADEPMRTMSMVLEHEIPKPSSLVPELSPEVDAVVIRALARSPSERYASAREMAIDLENAIPPAVPRVIGEWVEALVGDALKQRAARLIELGSESSAASAALALPASVMPPSVTPPPVTPPPEAAAAAPAPPAGPVVASATEAPVGASAPTEPAGPVPTPAEATPPPASAPRAEPSSQVSEVSTAAWDTAAQRSLFPRQGRQLKIVVASVVGSAALFFVVVLIFVSVRGKGDAEPDVVQVAAPAAAQKPPALPEPAAVPAPDTPAAPAVPEPEKPEPPKLVASAADRPKSAPVAPEPAKPAAPKPAVPAPVEAAAPKPPPPKPPGDCNPPWVVDANGIKKFKRHCL